MDYGFEETTTEVGGINEFESIKLILLERDYPKKYLDELAKTNQENLEKAQVLGTDFVEKTPNFKSGGVVWKYAILSRGKGEKVPTEKIFLPNDEGHFDEPKFACYGQISQLPPQQIYEKKWYLGEGGDVHGAIDSNGFPFIKRFLPRVFPAYDWNKRRSVTDIPDHEDTEDANTLRSVELLRKSQWNQVINKYETFTEEQALTVLEMSLSYRFLIGNRGDIKYNYVRPAKGVSFGCRRGPIKNKYLEIQPWAYNKDTKRHDIFNAVESHEPTAMDEYAADMIIATRQASFAKRKKKEIVDPQF